MTITELIFAILGSILTTLFGYLTTLAIVFITKKIKDEKLRKFVLEINNIVIENVKYTYQVYVEGMKNESLFNKEAQQIALQKCKQLCLGKFSDEMKNYIELNFGDIQNWLSDKIETTIYDLKNKGGNK